MPIYRPSLKRQFQHWVNRRKRNRKYYPGETVTIETNTIIDPEYKRIVNVVYEANGGVGEPIIDNTNYVIGDTVTIAETSYTREWCIFAGWMVPNDTTIYQPGDTYVIPDMYDDLIFEAQWEHDPEAAHTIVYVSGGGGGSQEQDETIYYNNDKIRIPECTYTAPEGQDEEFTCWQITRGEEIISLQPKDTYRVSEHDDKEIQIVASWKQRDHTVEFGVEHGTGTQTPDENIYHIDQPIPIPTHEYTHEAGYKFDCWYVMTQDEGIPRAEGETYTVQNGDPLVIRIVAEFTQVEHTIAFEHDEHSEGDQPEDETVYYYNDPIPLPDCKYTALDGYTFNHWRIDLGQKFIVKQPGETYVVQDGDAETIKIRAVYELTEHHVKFSARGQYAGGTQTPDTNTYHMGEIITIPAPEYEPNIGCKFVNWIVKCQDGEVIRYTGDTYQVQGKDPEEIEIIAKYDWIYHTVKLVPDAHCGGSQELKGDYHYEQHIRLPEPTGFTPMDGYEFKQWEVHAGSGVVAKQPDEYYYVQLDDPEEITIQAVHAVIEHTVKYDCLEHGSGTQEQDTNKYTIGQKIKLKPCTYEAEEGYIFDSWIVVCKEGEIPMAEGEEYVIKNCDPLEIEILAYFVEQEYTVELDANGGTGEQDFPGIFHLGDQFKVPRCTFTRTYYEFTNWKVLRRTGYEQKSPGWTFYVAEVDYPTIKFFANWHEVYYTLTFDAEGGGGTQAPDPTHYHTDDWVKMPECTFTHPEGEDKKFTGWLIYNSDSTMWAGNPGELYPIAETTTDPIVAHAEWTAVGHKFQFQTTTDIKSGSPFEDEGTYFAGVTFTVPEFPSSWTPVSGKKFARWWYRNKAYEMIYVAPGEEIAVGLDIDETTVFYPEMVDEDTKLYTITYYRNPHANGENPVDKHVYLEGEPITMAPHNYTWDAGYEFEGHWIIYISDEKEDWQLIAPGDTYVCGSLETETRNELAARGKEKAYEYSIAFNPGEHGSGTQTDETKYHAGDNITLPECKFEPVGDFTFNHWEFTTKSGETVRKHAGETYKIDTDTPKVITLTAYWYDGVNFHIQFDAGEGSGTQPEDTTNYQIGENITMPICRFTPPVGLKEFDHWYIKDTETRTFTIDEEGVYPVTSFSFEPIVVTAVYGVIEHTLRFDPGDHGTGTQTDDTKYKMGDTIVLPNFQMTADDGYTFDSWVVETRTGQSEKMNPGTEIFLFDQMMFLKEIVITATYTHVYSKLHYSRGEHTSGSQPQDDTEYHPGEKATMAECKFTVDDGYEFYCWQVMGSRYSMVKPGGTYTIQVADENPILVEPLCYPKSSAGAVYEVEYTAGTGSGSQTQDTSKYSLGDIITMYPCEFTAPKGKSFKCWRVTTAKSRTWTDLQPGEIYEITENDNELINICAIWK